MGPSLTPCDGGGRRVPDRCLVVGGAHGSELHAEVAGDRETLPFLATERRNPCKRKGGSAVTRVPRFGWLAKVNRGSASALRVPPAIASQTNVVRDDGVAVTGMLGGLTVTTDRWVDGICSVGDLASNLSRRPALDRLVIVLDLRLCGSAGAGAHEEKRPSGPGVLGALAGRALDSPESSGGRTVGFYGMPLSPPLSPRGQ